jgi:hypothetical protein
MKDADGRSSQLFGPNGAPAGSRPTLVTSGGQPVESPRGAAFGKVARAEARAAEALEHNRILQEKAEQVIAQTVHDVQAAFALLILRKNGPVFVSDADWLDAKRHAGFVSELPLPLPVSPAKETGSAWSRLLRRLRGEKAPTLPTPGRWVGFVQQAASTFAGNTPPPEEAATSEGKGPDPAPDGPRDPGESTEPS